MTIAPRAPSPEDIEVIGAWPEAPLRNLRITSAYHDLSTAFARRVGPGANWCTFATWASRQAGQSIRGEDLGRKIQEIFTGSAVVCQAVERVRDLRRALGRAVDASAVLAEVRRVCAPLLAVSRVSDAVARGNKKVFEEIAHAFARVLAAAGPGGLDEARRDAFGAGFRPGDPPGAQRLLAAGFRDYERARRQEDLTARAQRMFLANLRISLHEQTRLARVIRGRPVPPPA